MTDMCNLIEERYGWPGEPGQRRRPAPDRVKALDWELERFAEMVTLDPIFAAAAKNCQLPFHRMLMHFRYKWRIYRAPGGYVLHAVDTSIKQPIDRTQSGR